MGFKEEASFQPNILLLFFTASSTFGQPTQRERYLAMLENNEKTEYVVIFRTGKLWEFDLARDTLKEHNIPFFAQTQSLSGVQTAFDVAPSMGPGVSWSLLVPGEGAVQARELLQASRLDVGKEPEAWDFAPQPKVKKYWKAYIWGVIILMALLFLVEILPRILP